MKFYMLFDYDDGSSTKRVRKEQIETETLEEALQRYNAFKANLEATAVGGCVLGLERIDQEEVTTKIL